MRVMNGYYISRIYREGEDTRRFRVRSGAIRDRCYALALGSCFLSQSGHSESGMGLAIQ